jgi:hypothetical protein
VRDTAPTTTYIVTIDDHEEHCATPEEVSSVVAQYQMEHADDPYLRRISVVARRSGDADQRLPAEQFLPQQIP